MKIILDEILERDIDLLVMDLFSKSEDFFRHFCEEVSINLSACSNMISIEHSYTDSSGESDITVIYEDADETVGILIENKIAALPQPDQKKRYYLRGEAGISEGRYSKFYVVLIAPEEYCKADTQMYENQVTYEKLLDLVEASDLSDKEFCSAMLRRAIYKKENEHGYTMIPDDNATDFINGYIRFWKENGFDKRATMTTREGRKHPSSGGWIDFAVLGVKGLSLTHKADRGFVDLTFSKCKGLSADIHDVLVSSVDNAERYDVVDLQGVSAAIRLKSKEMKTTSCFHGQEPEALEAMESVVELSDLVKKLDWKRLEELLEKGAAMNAGKRFIHKKIRSGK